MEDLKVTVIQFDINWEDKTANFEELEANYFNKMSVGTSDFVVLPEMFATGFTMRPDLFWEDKYGQTTSWLKKWAKALNCCIGGGIITRKSENQFQNTFLVVFPDGNIEEYHKRHLFRMGEENKYYVQGNSPRIIDINGWKINLQVCYDLRFPVFIRNKIEHSKPIYDVIVFIANWPEIRIYAWTNLLQARAIENQAFVIGVNRIGLDGNDINHSGESAIIDPIGKYILEPIVSATAMKTTVLYYSVLVKARESFPLLLDADQFTLADN